MAEQGHDVELIERSGRAGGKVLGYCCKATDECSQCGVCVAHTAVSEALHHQRVNVTVGASVEEFRNNAGTICARVARRNPSISYGTCTGCDACVEACPAKCIEKYHRGGLIEYTIDHSKCLLHQGSECDRCATSCPASAIVADTATTQLEMVVDGALIATGHDAFDARKKPRLGYGRLEDVITGEEAEQILSRQSFLKTPAESVAFVQCVGSRDPQIRRNYCSSVCCAYALRLARMLKYRNPDADVTVYYMDLQNFDKTFDTLHQKLVHDGIKFARGLPFRADRGRHGKLRIEIEHATGEERTAEHDVVVLSVGLQPATDAGRTASLFGLDRDEFGFLKSELANVFVAGTCAEPQSILDAMASARAVALDMGKARQ